MARERIDSIQMLRGFAALFVVIFHFREILPFGYESFLGHFVIRGYSGVDLFFVISGFIAFYTVNKMDSGESNSGLCYFIKRLAKIAPLYYIFTFLSSGHTLESFIQTAKSLAFIPIGLEREGPIYGGARVGQGWTLNYEMYFYLIVAFSFWFGKFKWLFVYSFILLMIALPVTFLGIPTNYGHEGFNFKLPYLSMITNPINLEFLLGITVGMAYSRMDNKINHFWILTIAVSLIYFFLNFYDQFNYYTRITAWGIPSALLILSFLKLERTKKIKIPNIFITLGNMSFSIYIVHAGVIDIFTKIADHTFNKGVESYSAPIGLTIFFISLLVTFIISKFTYKHIELNLSSKIRKWMLTKVEMFASTPTFKG